jgi:hypothetical protein
MTDEQTTAAAMVEAARSLGVHGDEITVEYAVRVPGFTVPQTSLNAARRYAAATDASSAVIVSRFCTPWQEEEAQ